MNLSLKENKKGADTQESFRLYNIKKTKYNGRGLVIENTLHKGTSKCHKTDENSTHISVHITPSIFEFSNYPTTSRTLSKM